MPNRTQRAERARARWGSLSRERVLRAAIELADAEGIDALSMRRLGQELGAEPMSLYHWFRSKDELLRRHGRRGLRRDGTGAER